MDAQYPPDVIRRCRERWQADDFRRKVVDYEPVTLRMDRLRLECGHQQPGDYALLEKLQTEIGRPSLNCEECAEEWLRQAAKEEEKNS